MPASVAMHSMPSQESLHNDMPTVSSPVKHVRFAPGFENTRRHSSESLDSIPESNEDANRCWGPDSSATSPMPRAQSGSPCPADGHEFVRDPSRSTQSCACGKLRHSDIKHAAHRIPNGKTRRESVEGFDDVKRRWSLEWMSDQSAIVDEPWGFDSMGAEPSLSTKFGVHHW